MGSQHWDGATQLIAWCPRLQRPATECHHDGCTHWMVDRPIEKDEADE